MHRFRFVFWLSVVITSVSGHLKVQAQDSQAVQVSSLSQKVEARNGIAKFEVSLSPDKVNVGGEVVLSIRVFIEQGWHIGATATAGDSIGFPTQIQFAPVGLEPIDGAFASSAQARKQELGAGAQWLMEGEFAWTRKYRVMAADAKYSGTGSIRFQACDDKKCLPPQTVEFALGEARPQESNAGSATPMIQNNGAPAMNAEKIIGAPIVVGLEPCELTRPRPQMGNIVSLLVFGRPNDQLVWKGTIPSGPATGVNIYLPKAKRYSLRNTGHDGTRLNNTATYVSVDQNKDGALADWEAAPVDRPIRIQDSMFRITAIDAETKSLTLQQVDVPLQGSLIGFRCPDFEYTALDGSIISNKSILGKVTILDIWAVTCHNCYEGFPKIQRALDKHSTDKLSVVLLTVDTDRKFYDSLAPNLFKTYGGANWPQVMIPGSFEGARTIGDYGFGSVVVDETGIVRAVGALGFNIESIIDEVIKNSANKAPSEATGASHSPATKTRVAMNRETLLDCFPGLSDRLDGLRSKNELLTLPMIEKSIANPLGLASKPKLEAPSNAILSPLEIAAKLRKCKLHVGWFFKCNHCDNWHLNFGAGYAVAEDGVVATCHHVVAPASSEMKEGYLVVMDVDGNIYKVEGVIAADAVSDCALIKIAGAGELSPLPLNLAPQVGGDSYVLSNPLGMSDYFSHGLINRVFVNSANQDLSESEAKRRMRLNVGAHWAPGSSGAPIVDQCGNLIGFVSAARQLMGPAGQSQSADGKPEARSAERLTTLLTAHEAGTAIALEMLIDCAVK